MFFCKKIFAKADYLRKHKILHSFKNPYFCFKCSKAFKRAEYLTNHLLTHSSERPHSCTKCNKSYISSSSLAYHTLTHGNKNYACEHCNKSFLRSNQLNIHKLIHTREEDFVCEDCGNSYRTLAHLNSHKLDKYKKKIYECVFCKKSFYSKFSQMRHENIHKTKEPKSFAPGQIPLFDVSLQKVRARVDTMIELEDNLWRCKVCDKTVQCKSRKSKSIIISHVETKHIDGVNYKCDMCDNIFNSRAHWRKHKSRKHKDSVSSVPIHDKVIMKEYISPAKEFQTKCGQKIENKEDMDTNTNIDHTSKLNNDIVEKPLNESSNNPVNKSNVEQMKAAKFHLDMAQILDSRQPSEEVLNWSSDKTQTFTNGIQT